MTQNKIQLVEEKQQLKMKSYIQDSEYSAMLSSRIYGNVQNDVSNPQLFKEIGEISIMMVKFYEIEKIAKKHSHDIVKVSYVIKEKIKDILQKGENCVVFNYNSKVSEYFVILPAEYYSITSLARNLLNEFDIAEYGPVSIALYENCNSFNEIGNVYREMVTSLVTRPFSRCHFIIKCTNKNRMPEFTNIFSNEFEAELLYQLDKKQKSKVKENLYVKSGLHEAKTKNWSFIEMKQYIIQVRTILYNYVKRNIPEKLNETEDILENLEKGLYTLNFDTVVSSLELLVDNFWRDEELGDSDSIETQVIYVHDYISQNYGMNISLSSLSEKFYVDASYLSRMFSKKYGETITSYLTKVRIEQAKELIADKSNKLETISFVVGYEDYNYFSRVFKKKTGLSPREYRKQISIDDFTKKF